MLREVLIGAPHEVVESQHDRLVLGKGAKHCHILYDHGAIHLVRARGRVYAADEGSGYVNNGKCEFCQRF